MEAEWKWMRSDGSRVWKGASQGVDKGETRGKRARGKSYHDRSLTTAASKGLRIL